MTLISRLRQALKKEFSVKQDTLERFPGYLGDGLGNVETGTQNVVWARVNESPVTVICETVPHVNDLSVWVGFSPYQPGVLRVLSQRLHSSSITTRGGITNHHWTHEWFGNGADGGTDLVMISGRAIHPKRVYPAGPLQVAVYPDFYWAGGTSYVFVGDTTGATIAPDLVDLSGYAVTTDGKAKFMLVYVNSAGVVSVVEGAEVDIDDLDPETDIPALPSGEALAAVRMYFALSDFIDGKNNTDFVDLRKAQAHIHTGASIALGLDDLTDVTITGPANLDLLQYNGAAWVDRTYAEADVATETDLAIDEGNLATHIADLANPHEVNAADIGMGLFHEHVYNENMTLVCDGVETIFGTNNEYQPETSQPILNGVRMILDADYTETDLYNSVTLTAAPLATDTLIIDYMPA